MNEIDKGFVMVDATVIKYEHRTFCGVSIHLR
jgi:hypothetical protein